MKGTGPQGHHKTEKHMKVGVGVKQNLWNDFTAAAAAATIVPENLDGMIQIRQQSGTELLHNFAESVLHSNVDVGRALQRENEPASVDHSRL